MKSGKQQGQEGFTLIELVIVVVIVAVTLALSTPSMIENLRNKAVTTQNLSLISMLNLAKSEAIRRNTSVNVVFTTGTGTWTAIVEDPAEEAEIEGCATGQLRCLNNTDVDLTIGVTSLSFNNRGYIRDLGDTWAAETLYLQHETCSGTTMRRRIDITPTGQISSCALACDSTATC